MQALREREAAGSSGVPYAERTGVPVKPLLREDFKDASIEAVGVYEAENSSRGAGDTRVVRINGYAYEANSNGYGALDGEVRRFTGRRIESFQGRYGGKTFMVGGR